MSHLGWDKSKRKVGRGSSLMGRREYINLFIHQDICPNYTKARIDDHAKTIHSCNCKTACLLLLNN